MSADSGTKKIYAVTLRKDPDLSSIERLRECGYSVDLIADLQEFQTCLLIRKPDLVLLDLDLSDPASFPALVRIRKVFRGLLAILSAYRDETFHILALELGADDYIGGSVSPDLVFARIKALLRRAGCERVANDSTIVLGDLTIDAARREVLLCGFRIEFTTLEFDLLWYLARNAGTVVTRNDIHLTIYNREYNGMDRSIDMYISRLRQKLGDDHAAPRLLKTVRGSGYLMSRLMS